jgi:hypothetical protein
MAGRLVHAIAECRECEWSTQDYRVATRQARQHHRKTGHQVSVETGYCYIIGELPPGRNEIEAAFGPSS